MKPTKNTIYCHGCQRTKMLFETKAKADNFIRYNSEGIQEENGKAPVRSYYCGICGGYHVTSNPSKADGERLDSRDRQRIEALTKWNKERNKKKGGNSLTQTVNKRETEEAKKIALSISNRVVRIKTHLMYGELTDAEDLLDVCDLDLEEIHKYPLTVYSKQLSLNNKVEKTKELFLQVKEVLGLPEQEQQAFISQMPRDRKKFSLANVLFYAFTLRRIGFLLQQAEALLDEGETNDVEQIISECKRLVGDIAFIDKNQKTVSANGLIQEMERRLRELTGKGMKKEDSQSVPPAETSGNEHAGDGTSPPEDVDDCPKKKAQTKEYVSTILQLIKKIEEIQKAFEEEDYDNCESLVEIASFILDDLDPEDENVKTIADQLDKWKQRLEMTP